MLKDFNSMSEEFSDIEKYVEYEKLEKQLQLLEKLNIMNPYFKMGEGVVNNRIVLNSKDCINYSSYNYLGLSGELEVKAGAKDAIDCFGTSVSASRIVAGEKTIHRELEKEIADFLGVDNSLVFISGYLTNSSVIGFLLRENDLIIHDSLVHNSILNGCLLSKANRFSFPHNNAKMLDKILEINRDKYERVLIAVEGVYSMDGDLADLPALIEIKKKYNTLLMVDEAHSMGTVGKTGRGITEYFNCNAQDVNLLMGTLSKSFASSGGYIAGSDPFIKYLKYTTPGFLFSVGLSPADTGAALAALRVLKKEPARVSRIQKNSKHFLQCAKEKGLDTGLSYDSPIIPVIIGDSLQCLKISEMLLEKYINVYPIIYPAVPEDASRLRFFITSEHTEDEIKYTVDSLCEILNLQSLKEQR